MPTRKNSPRTRAFRPETDDLESRQLLSTLVSGTDSKGDTWTLQLIGPGQISVVKQNDPSGNPASLTSATDIKTITIGGTVPTQSRLVGTVTKVGTNSDGRVFFNNLIQLPSRSESLGSAGLGILSIDMPNFWLGRTTPTGSSTSTEPGIAMPDGTDTLRFGGVDATHNLPTPTATTASDTIFVTMGLPTYGGTRILIDKSISGSEQAPASSATTQPTTVQHGVDFVVSGRLTLFQANQIVGDVTHAPGQFGNISPGATGSGGTTVFSGVAGTGPFFVNGNTFKGQVTGQIGNLRIGGDAANFTAIVNDATGSGNDRISNFSIGGETNNVLVLAPNGLRNAVFGKGLDNTEIYTHVVNTLTANRDATNSNVYVDRQISRVQIGGNVTNTKILAGVVQNFTSIYQSVSGQSTSVFSAGTPSAPAAPLAGQPGGGMTIHVAGDVTNSIFAASYEPFNGVYGDPNALALTDGSIRGKIEGNINNATATPSKPLLAFYAKNVYPLSGPVIPPSVPEAPYTGKQPHTFLPGIHHHTTSSKVKAASVAHVAAPVKSVAVTIPKGPIKSHSTTKK